MQYKDGGYPRQGSYGQSPQNSQKPIDYSSRTIAPSAKGSYTPFQPYSEYGLRPLQDHPAGQHHPRAYASQGDAPQTYAQPDHPSNFSHGQPSHQSYAPEDLASDYRALNDTQESHGRPASPRGPQSALPSSQGSAWDANHSRLPLANELGPGKKRTRIKDPRPISYYISEAQRHADSKQTASTCDKRTALTNIARSIDPRCEARTVELLLDWRPFEIPRQQLPFAESLVKRYAEFEASRQAETPWSKWIFTELNTITGGKITKGHPNGTLMDSSSQVYNEFISNAMSGQTYVNNPEPVAYGSQVTQSPVPAALRYSEFNHQHRPAGESSGTLRTEGVSELTKRQITQPEHDLISALPEPYQQHRVKDLLKNKLTASKFPEAESTLRDMVMAGTELSNKWVQALSMIPNGMVDARTLVTELQTRLEMTRARIGREQSKAQHVQGSAPRSSQPPTPGYGYQPGPGSAYQIPPSYGNISGSDNNYRRQNDY